MENIVNMQNELKVTSIEDLKSSAIGEVVQLPAFDENHPFVARLRRPSLLAMAKSGKIPNTLISAANDLFVNGAGGTAVKNIKDDQMMKQMFDILDLLCSESLVEPSYKELQDAGIGLTDEQYLFIFEYTQRGVKALENFRQ